MRTLRITHLVVPNIYVSSVGDILLIVLAAEAFVNNDYKAAPLDGNYIYIHVTSYLVDLHVCHIE